MAVNRSSELCTRLVLAIVYMVNLRDFFLEPRIFLVGYIMTPVT